MKSLIITLYTYDFIPYIAGTVLQEKNKDFELLRIFSDNTSNIFWCRNLCASAIFEQRRYDLIKIGTTLNIKKVVSFNYNEDIFDTQLKSMITKLKVYTLFNMIDEIYIPDHLLFINIFKELQKENSSKIYIYGEVDKNKENKEIKRVILDREIYEDKIDLRRLMIGIHKKEQLDLYKPIERFYKDEIVINRSIE